VTSQACTRQVLLETIGDLLWIDVNGDGRQDNVGGFGGETPIAGAEVRLRLQSTSALVATTTTNAAGIYTFDRRQHGLQPNTQYIIETDQRPGLHVTLADQVADNLDSDAISGTFVTIRGASVAPASHNLTFDFGFASPILIGDFVWRDLNGNGVQDDGASSALPGVIVQLRDSNGAVLATTTTSSTGLYSVLVAHDERPRARCRAYSDHGAARLAAGARDHCGRPRHVPRADARPAGHDGDRQQRRAQRHVVERGAVHVHAAAATGIRTTSRLDVGLDERRRRLGVQIGNFVFLDNNSNGVQDGTDTPLVGVQVQLLDSAGATIASTTTGAGGIYTFSSATTSALLSQTAFTLSLPTGQPILAGRLVTPANQGGDDALDSDAVLDSATGRINIAITTPIDGQSDFTFDFGVRQVAIGGDVWRDADGAGDNDGGEPRLGAVLVTLYDATGTTPLATTLTAADGTYLFSSDAFPAVRPGTTYVIGVTLPTGTQPTLADAVAGNDVIDSDGRIRTGSTTEVLSSAVVAPLTGTNTDTDFGLVSRFSIGNFVWHDVNGDGDQDSGEGGLVGVTVVLLSGAVEVARTATVAGGLYSFDSLLPGRALPQTTGGFSLEVNMTQAALAGFVPTAPDAATATALLDSDGILDSARGVSRITLTTPTYGTNDPQFDFGFRSIVVGNRVWNDAERQRRAGRHRGRHRQRAGRARVVDRHRAGEHAHCSRRHLHVHGGQRRRERRRVCRARRVRRRSARRPCAVERRRRPRHDRLGRAQLDRQCVCRRHADRRRLGHD
jgi:hypothetical protein